MCTVVRVGRQGFTVCAKVSIVADGALVAHARDVSAVTAERTVAANAVVPSRTCLIDDLKRLIDRHEAVAGVNEVGTLVAARAVVEVRAVQALVANAVNLLVAAVADRMVILSAARLTSSRCGFLKNRRISSGGECVGWVMAVSTANVARDAEIKVIAVVAGDKLGIVIDGDARIASAAGLKLESCKVLLNR